MAMVRGKFISDIFAFYTAITIATVTGVLTFVPHSYFLPFLSFKSINQQKISPTKIFTDTGNQNISI